MKKFKNKMLFAIILLCCFQILSGNNNFGDNLNNSHLKITNTAEEVDTNRVYSWYETDLAPQFPGGNDSLRKFINTNFKRTGFAQSYEGEIVVCIFIHRDGSIIRWFIPGKLQNELFKDNVKDLIDKMPIWEAGKIQNTSVKTLICIPIIIVIR